MPALRVYGRRLEYELLGRPSSNEPTIVMLHEGLGSVAQWRGLPALVHTKTGRAVIAYSRWGYGNSDPIPPSPRPIDYVRWEAERVLPAVLNRLEIKKPLLLGHSDGASIALVYAGSGINPVPVSVISMAAHLFVEKVTTIGIAKARLDYEQGDLRPRLARFHRDVDGAFYSWNTTWLLPTFIARFDIQDAVRRIGCPLSAIQGRDDEYGTLKQLDAIRTLTRGRAEILLLPNRRHAPYRDQPEATLRLIMHHVDRAYRRHAKA